MVLAVVMVGAGYLLFQKSNELIGRSTQTALREATLAEKLRKDHPSASSGTIFRQNGSEGRSIGSGVGEFDATILVEPFEGREAHVYSVDKVSLLAPLPLERPADDLKGLFFVVTALVILTGGGAAALVAMQVSKPLHVLVDDVRTIARGNLRHKTRVRTGGEVGHLARSSSARPRTSRSNSASASARRTSRATSAPRFCPSPHPRSRASRSPTPTNRASRSGAASTSTSPPERVASRSSAR